MKAIAFAILAMWADGRSSNFEDKETMAIGAWIANASVAAALVCIFNGL